jgi:hypothetical protein
LGYTRLLESSGSANGISGDIHLMIVMYILVSSCSISSDDDADDADDAADDDELETRNRLVVSGSGQIKG